MVKCEEPMHLNCVKIKLVLKNKWMLAKYYILVGKLEPTKISTLW